MTIELSKQARNDSINSIERYFAENFSEYIDGKLGNIAAGELLDYFLTEIGPAVYNQAVTNVQEKLQIRVMELDIEVHEDEFQYWRKNNRKPIAKNNSKL